MKKYLTILLGIILIVLGVFIFKGLSASNADVSTQNTPKKEVLSVSVLKVMPRDIPYLIETTGTLEAKEKIEIYSEVQGVLKKTKTPFKIGNQFNKGEPLVAIHSEEQSVQVKATRSDLINQIAAMLPDMEIDYPDQYKKWEIYLQQIDIHSSTPLLPVATSNEEKLFISGKNIYNTFYTIKNQEEKLTKYIINAPFSGIVTESNVRVGSLIRSGQKIGEFIDDSRYELQASVPVTENQYLVKGAEIDLITQGDSQTIKGTISRINGKINRDTQSITIIVDIVDETVKDGQYLTAKIKGQDLKDVVRIHNSLILENNQVYIITDGVLKLIPIKVLNYQNDHAIVRGIPAGTTIVNQKMANAYPGMLVKALKK